MRTNEGYGDIKTNNAVTHAMYLIQRRLCITRDDRCCDLARVSRLCCIMRRRSDDHREYVA